MGNSKKEKKETVETETTEKDTSEKEEKNNIKKEIHSTSWKYWEDKNI